MQPSNEFLTPEECAEVDKALLTSREKFSARVAVYALRSLKQIAQANGVTITQLDSQQIEAWVYQDESLQTGIDREFRQFFSQLVIASMKPLRQMAAAAGVPIEAIGLAQVIDWFEQQAKLNLGNR
jgi:tRNA A37 N6-isopentenylltransferase MiaA